MPQAWQGGSEVCWFAVVGSNPAGMTLEKLHIVQTQVMGACGAGGGKGVSVPLAGELLLFGVVALDAALARSPPRRGFGMRVILAEDLRKPA